MDKAKQLRMVQQMFGKKTKSKSSVLKDRTNKKRKKFTDLEKKSSKKKKRKVRFADVRFNFFISNSHSLKYSINSQNYIFMCTYAYPLYF